MSSTTAMWSGRSRRASRRTAALSSCTTSVGRRSIRPRAMASRRRWESMRRNRSRRTRRCSTRRSCERIRGHPDLHAAFPPETRAPSASLTQRLFRHIRGSPAVFVTHELLRRETVEERAYQVNIARACLERSTLVVLPTGMGKTVIAAIVFDEAHRAVGDYAYVDVAAAYKEVPDRLVLGKTASPGSSAEKILEVCGNLGITAVEIRTEYDPDVVPYQHDLQIEQIPVEAPDVSKEIRKLLQTVVDEQVARLKKLGFLAGRARVTRKDLLAVGNEARARLDRGVKDGRLYGAMTAQAIAMKADHAIELAETQGLGSLRLYFENMRKDTKTKADVQFLKHAKVQEAIQLAEATEVEHPKLAKTGWIVRKQLMEKADSKIIVFAHYRQTADRITQELTRIPSVKPMRFVGQASRGEDIGLSQKEQVDILDKFRAGEVNVLVATSIGEEGLDIPQVDLVVFYEPVPSEIRTIQRRGRTGRSAAGRVVMLVTKDTRAAAYFYSARGKERKMHVELDRLRKELKQKIFVGEPGSETFVAAAPERRIEALREQAREPPTVPEPRQRASKKGQTTVEDF